jgi:hypothetical protein
MRIDALGRYCYSLSELYILQTGLQPTNILFLGTAFDSAGAPPVYMTPLRSVISQMKKRNPGEILHLAGSKVSWYNLLYDFGDK